nr:uncharacterized protein LOC117442807 [Pseudochaenichthys georgianus]
MARVPQNCPRTYKLMSFDPDGDTVRCRYGDIRNIECSGCNQPSGFVLDQGSCSLHYRNAIANPSVFGFELVVEDFPQRPISLSYTDGTQSYKAPLIPMRHKRASFQTYPPTTSAQIATPALNTTTDNRHLHGTTPLSKLPLQFSFLDLTGQAIGKPPGPPDGQSGPGFTAHRRNVVVWDKGFGKFTYEFEFYPDSQYRQMIDPGLYPLEYDVTDRIFMQIEAKSTVNNTQLFVESCSAAPYDTPNYWPTYSIIENGPAVSEQRGFINSPLTGHHHHRKREAITQSARHFISQGPLRLKRSAESTGSPATPLNLNLVFIVGCLLAAAGMISAVALYKVRASKVKYQPLASFEN